MRCFFPGATEDAFSFCTASSPIRVASWSMEDCATYSQPAWAGAMSWSRLSNSPVAASMAVAE